MPESAGAMPEDRPVLRHGFGEHLEQLSPSPTGSREQGEKAGPGIHAPCSPLPALCSDWHPQMFEFMPKDRSVPAKGRACPSAWLRRAVQSVKSGAHRRFKDHPFSGSARPGWQRLLLVAVPCWGRKVFLVDRNS